MIETVDTVITKAAVRGARWPKDFAREAVLQLHRLTLHEHLLRARRWPICGAVERVRHLDLLLDICRLILGCPWNDARIAERSPE